MNKRNANNMIEIRLASYKPDFYLARELFFEYAHELNLKLDLQGTDKDFIEIQKVYTPPNGFLLLATYNYMPAGCVCLSKGNSSACEMRRLFVRKEYRSLGIGRQLVVDLISRARAVKYMTINLDVTPTLKNAIALYKSLGFEIYSPQNEHHDEVLYMQLHL